MEQVVETVGGYALEKNVQINLDVSPYTWVIGDWDQLHSLFVNVLSNAVRHAKSSITIISVIGNGDTKAIIRIMDDGDGFTKEDLAHAFDYFYTGNKKGSGLGLTIAKKIVEEHSGTIKINNSAQGGAVVEIILPSASGPQP